MPESILNNYAAQMKSERMLSWLYIKKEKEKRNTFPMDPWLETYLHGTLAERDGSVRLTTLH
jgi:hypothetical protein